MAYETAEAKTSALTALQGKFPKPEVLGMGGELKNKQKKKYAF